MQRRNFIKKGALASLTAPLETEIVFGEVLPLGYNLLGLQDPDPFQLFSKDKEMVVLNDKPWNMEARATDSNGLSQPMLLPGWNPKGYLNNACHRIAVKVK